MSIGSSIKNNLKGIIIGFVAIVLIAGGIYGWRVYQFRQSPEYLVETLQKALTAGDTLTLAQHIDLNTILSHLSRAVAMHYPFIEKGPNQVEAISQRVKTALVAALGNTKKPGNDLETDEEKKLLRPLVILPPDFTAQCASSMILARVSGQSATLMLPIKHPQLENKTFQLAFSLQKTSSGWRVADLANANQVVQEFRAAQLQRMAAKREVYKRKYEASGQAMKNILPLQSCTVSAGMLSDKRTVLAVIHVLARNIKQTQIKNVNLLTAIENNSGKEILRRNLNAAHEVQPGEDFEYRWTLDLDASDPLAQQLLAAPSLVCKARWFSMTLASGKILYDVENIQIPEDFQ